MIEWYKFALPWAVGNVMVDLVSLAKKKSLKLKNCDITKIGIIYEKKYDFHLPLIECNPYIDLVLTKEEFQSHNSGEKILDPTNGQSWNYLIKNPEVVRFKVPKIEEERVCAKVFKESKIDLERDKIFAFHARSPGYKYYPEKNRHPQRFVNLSTFENVAKYYLEKGYKVIRIGGQESPDLSFIHENLFDSSKISNKTIMDDCCLISKSDLFVGTDSGMWLIAVSLGVPTLLSNNLHGKPGIGMKRWWFPWEDGHEVLHKIPFRNGKEISGEEMVKLFGGMGWKPEKGISFKDNTCEQIIECCKKIETRKKKQ